MKRPLPYWVQAVLSAPATKHALLFLSIFVLSLNAFAHRVEAYSSTGCAAGQNLVVNAIVTNSPSNTWHSWQYKDGSGTWKCFVNGSNTINGVSFTVSGAKAQNAGNNAPVLTINNVTTALEGVQVRILLRDGAEPCGAPAGTTWGGDDQALNEVKVLRLRVYSGSGDCGGTTPGCLGNFLTNASGYYGGFENKVFNSSSATFTDNNFVSGAGSTQYTISQPTAVVPGTSGSGTAQVWNNPYSMNTGNGKFPPLTGNYQLIVQGSANTQRKAWFKTVSVVPGGTYVFSAWVARTQGSNAFNLRLTANGTDISTSAVATTVGQWNQKSGTYTVPAGVTSIEISISDVSTNAERYFSLDDICFRLSTTPASIGDRVWADTNGDGIQDAAETTGVSGVTVNLKNSSGVVVGTTTTNASGNYLFTGLPAGSYTVVFPTSSSAGILTVQNAGSNDDADSDPAQGTGETAAITLTAGQNVTNVDAGYQPNNLQLGSEVWIDVNNNGIRNSGEVGLANVTLRLYRDANNDNIPDGAAIATTTTNSSGVYYFTGLTRGNYIVGAVIPAGYTSSVVNGGDPDNNIDGDDNGQVLAPNNEIRGLAITLIGGTEPVISGAPGTAGNTNPTYDFGMLIDCECTNSTGNLLINGSFENGTTGWSGNVTTGTGYVVCGSKNGFNDWPGSGNSKVWQDVTMTAGATVTLSGFAGTHTAGQSCSPKMSLIFLNASNAVISQSDVTITRDVDVSGGELQEYTITAVAPANTAKVRVQTSINCDYVKMDAFCLTATVNGSIGDKVWNDLDRDGIQDSNEQGLAGINVSLFDGANALIASAVTDAYGIYKFSNLPVTSAGTNYQVRFSLAAGYVFTAQNSGGTGITGTTNSDANVTTGRTGNITLTLATPNVTYVDAGMYLTLPNRIGDFIWNDLDKDGVQDAGEPGIAGVVVTLYNSSNVPVRTTITDNNGHYEFNDVPAGSYTLGITPPAGYQASPQDQGGDDAKDSDFNPSTFRTASFTVTTGVNLTLDGGLNVTSATKAAVGDFVWADLDNDNVQDPSEPGIANVTVQLYSSANTLIATTTTNDLGYYVFNNVDPGNYYVKFSNTPAGYGFVTADAGSNDNIDSDVTGANGTGTTATFTLVADENKMTVDAGLRRTSALNSLGDFVWYDLDKDGIQDAGEAGVPGLTVTLYNATTGAVVKTTTTNAAGFYMFTDLAAGSYTVGVSNLPAGYAFSPVDAGADAADSDIFPGTGRTAPVSIVGTGNTITTVDAGIVSNPNVFDSKAAIGDFVWDDRDNDGIQDPGEPGLAGVTVTLYAANGTTVIATTTTDAFGEYQFSNLDAGTYIVGFSGLPEGYTLSSLPNAGTNDAKDSDADPVSGKTGPVTLLPGQVNTTVDAAAVSTSSGLGVIGNFVWNDADGNGHQGATETGVPGVSVFLLNSTGDVIDNTVTDANGAYLFTNVVGGTYRIRIGNLPAGFVATTKDATPANDATDSDADPATLTTDNFTLAAGGSDLTRDFGIRSTTTASVGDYVWNDTDMDGVQDAGEAGIAGVLVTLYNNSGTAVASAVTDADGKYLFINVTPGTYTIGFSGLPAGSSFTTKDQGSDAADSDVNPATGRTDAFTLAAGQSNTTIDAGLVTTYAAVGNYVWTDLNSNGIQDAGEPPVAGITVILYNSSNVAVASAVTDGNGYYFINNIPASPAGTSYTIGFSDLPAATVLTKKNAAGSTTENDSDPNVATGRTDAFTLTAGQIRLDIDAGLIKLVSISGNVWHDVNAMTDNLVNNSGASQVPPAVAIPANLRAYLVNMTTGLVERVVAINPADGKFTFANVTPNTTYYVLISSAFGTVGVAPPVSTLPSGWLHTGQKLGITSGSDGLNDGRLIVPVTTSDVINANFGIKITGGDIVIG